MGGRAMRALFGSISTAFLLVAVPPAPAAASCFDCEANYDSCVAADTDGGNRYNCLVHKESCLASCEGDGGVGRSPVVRYGAISKSANGTLGVSSGFGDQASAMNAAVRDCQLRENAMVDCPIIVHFHNACGAVAADTGGAWGADWGLDASEAGSKALSLCSQYGGKNCVIVLSQCSG